MDGENLTLHRDYYHARSIDSKFHPSRTWLQNFHAKMKHLIPPDWRICGENLYAKHSIPYENLESYFLGFSIWDDTNTALSWAETEFYLEEFEIPTVPVLYTGFFDIRIVKSIISSLDIDKQEGIVVRIAGEIPYSDFDRCVAKWARPKHVETETHWMFSKLEVNDLKVRIIKNGNEN
jgi:hypothetical protein